MSATKPDSMLAGVIAMLKNRDPRVRQQGLTQLYEMQHPNARQAYQQIIDRDPDESTRRLAQYYLNLEVQKKQATSNQPAVAADTWKCATCGAENDLHHDTCQSCALPRPDDVGRAARLKQLAPDQEVAAEKLTPELWLVDPAHRLAVEHGLNPFDGKLHRTDFTIQILRSGAMAFLVIICFMGVLFALYQDYQKQRLLEVEGVTTTGQVIGTRVSESDETYDSYYVSYSYVVGGRRYDAEAKVDSSFYQTAELGNELSIIYAPSDPNISEIEGYLSEGALSTFNLALITVICVVGPLVIGILFSMYRRAAEADRVTELAQQGQMIDGRVLEVGRWYDDEDKVYHTQIKFRFVSPDTKEVVTTTHTFNDSEINRRNLPKRGNALKIMYANSRNYRIL